MINLGKENGMKVVCLLTNMDIPLGNNVGNALEVIESANILYYNNDNNLTKVSLEIATYMVKLGLNISYDEAKNRVMDAFTSKKAYSKFLEFISYQKGDIKSLPKASHMYEIKSEKEGYLTDISGVNVAKLSMHLGSGRTTIDDKIDYSAGIVLNKSINDKVNIGDVVMTLYSNCDIPEITGDLFTIGEDINSDYKLIYEVIE